MIRECRFEIEQSGFRCKEIIIATTLLDADEYTVSDLAELYWMMRQIGAVPLMDYLFGET